MIMWALIGLCCCICCGCAGDREIQNESDCPGYTCVAIWGV